MVDPAPGKVNSTGERVLYLEGAALQDENYRQTSAFQVVIVDLEASKERSVRHIVVLLMELIAEALLLGCFMGILAASRTGVLYGTLGAILALPVVLFLHWYYLTRTLAALICHPFYPRLYPVVAAAAFLIHAFVAFLRSKPDLTPAAKGWAPLFIAGGTCIVFACAFFGSRILRTWSAPAPQILPIHHDGQLSSPM